MLVSVALLASALLQACSDDTTPKTDLAVKPPDGEIKKDGSGTVTKGANIALACTSVPTCPSPGTSAGSAAATQLDLCTYNDSTKKLQVKFIGDSAKIVVTIEPFTGAGSYDTTADGKVDVVVGTKGTVPSDANAADISPDQKCTIAATSNLATIQIPATGDAKILDVVLDLTCAKLRAGGVCDEDCTVTPSSFQLAVKGCAVSK
jgi:hypothetical protein